MPSKASHFEMIEGALMIAYFFPKGYSQYQQLPVWDD
jgi:hypothetical protein